MRKLVCIVIFISLFFLVAPRMYAANSVIFPEASGGLINEAVAKTTNVRILPTSPIYFLVRSKEFFSRAFQPSSARRAGFDFLISSKRLKESYLLSTKSNNYDLRLGDYSDRIEKMLTQITKARFQNQDIQPILDQITDGFAYQEVLFFAISKNTDESSESFNSASLSFIKAIDAIDAFRPGFRNRFKSVKDYTVLKEKSSQPSLPPVEVEHFETTASANPKRIIY